MFVTSMQCDKCSPFNAMEKLRLDLDDVYRGNFAV